MTKFTESRLLLVSIVAILLLVALFLVKLHSNAEVCRKNLGTITLAVVEYNNRRRAPLEDLKNLVPEYLPAIPACPATGDNKTYFEGYAKNGYVCCDARMRHPLSKYTSGFFHW